MTESTARIPFRNLPRRAVTRTSAPTNAALRAAMLQVANGRASMKTPFADAVLLAALRVAAGTGAGTARDKTEIRARFVAEVERIEAETFAPEPGANEPGS